MADKKVNLTVFYSVCACVGIIIWYIPEATILAIPLTLSFLAASTAILLAACFVHNNFTEFNVHGFLSFLKDKIYKNDILFAFTLSILMFSLAVTVLLDLSKLVTAISLIGGLSFVSSPILFIASVFLLFVAFLAIIKVNILPSLDAELKKVPENNSKIGVRIFVNTFIYSLLIAAVGLFVSSSLMIKTFFSTKLALFSVLVANIKISAGALGVIKLGFLGTGTLAGLGYIVIPLVAISLIIGAAYLVNKYSTKQASASKEEASASKEEAAASKAEASASKAIVETKKNSTSD